MSDTQLHMRHNLQDLPSLEIPAGFRLRTLATEDLNQWTSLMNQNGELGEWDQTRSQALFAKGSPMPLSGAFVVVDDEVLVATAQLHLHTNDKYAPWPELGWVAALPAHRGRGLGRLVCLAVLRHAAAMGHPGVFLMTDDHRLPAIRTYLGLGFEPWMVDGTAAGRWAEALRRLDATPHESGGAPVK